MNNEFTVIKEWKDRPWHVGILNGHVFVSNGWTMDYPLYQRVTTNIFTLIHQHKQGLTDKGCVAYDNPESKPKYLTDWVCNAYYKGVLTR